MKSTHTFRFFNWLLLFLLFAQQSLAQTSVPKQVIDVWQRSYTRTRPAVGSAAQGSFTVPLGGPYLFTVTVEGGRGGNVMQKDGTLRTNGGRGAIVTSSFWLGSGTILDAVAGSNGQDGQETIDPNTTRTSADFGGGGGASSGVHWRGVGPLIVAAGGGGASGTGRGGEDARGYSSAGSGLGGNGANGNTTLQNWSGSGGGGWMGNGFNNATSSGGQSYVHGDDGGLVNPRYCCRYDNWGGSYGGGYSGGAGASQEAKGAGGGGGGYTGGDGGRDEFFLL